MHTLKVAKGPVGSLAVLEDGTLAAGSWDAIIRVWELPVFDAQSRCVATLKGPAGPFFVSSARMLRVRTAAG